MGLQDPLGMEYAQTNMKKAVFAILTEQNMLEGKINGNVMIKN